MTDDTPRPQQNPDPSRATPGQPESSQPPGQHPASAWNQPYGASPPPDSAPTDAWPAPAGGASPPTAPIGMPPLGAPGPRRDSRIRGAVVLSLLVGLVAGGVGGAVGYQFASTGPSVINALDQPASGALPIANLPNGSVEQVAQKVTPSVVQLRIRGARVAAEGSGIVLSSDGLILTNNHVVQAAASDVVPAFADDAELVAVMQDGRSVPAEIVGRAPSFDLAVVRAQDVNNLIPAQLGSSSDVRVGQEVVAIGSPLGLSGTVTTGIVSALNRPVRAGGEGSSQETVLDAIQTDAAINPGNSGGPLTDMQGRVIGINTAIASLGAGGGKVGSIGLGFAIPIDQAKRIANELIRTGQATQAVLGVIVPGRSQDGAAVVQQVTPDGAAAAAGIQPGELITKVDNRVIDTGDALVAAIRSYPPGSQVEITVKNPAGETRQVQVTLGSQQVGTR
ncbi:MAG: trypsin-like peptidase domain-containing protein [Actinomycetota bacterium]|nr:trypsin-like peptidase domain-containing protein [Actinomycetota bacterium]